MSEQHTVETITPALAEEWLTNNVFPRQRGVREHHVLTLAEEFDRGTYVPHSAIVFAVVDGRRFLIDGQHRLHAISLAKRTIQSPVLTRVATSMSQAEEWYGNIDQGLRRSSLDAVRARGLHTQIGLPEWVANRLTGAVKVLAAGFQTGGANYGIKAGGRSNGAIAEMLSEWGSEATAFHSSMLGGEQSRKHLFYRAAVLACALLSFRYKKDEAQTFWSGLSQDDGLRKDDPRKKFLVWLETNPGSSAVKTARAFGVAWKAHLEGRSLQLFRVDESAPLKLSGIPWEEVVANRSVASEDLLSWRKNRKAGSETQTHVSP